MKFVRKGPGLLGRAVLCAALSVVAVGTASAQARMGFVRVAGGWTGDGGQAKGANLRGATDVVVDSAGNVYVSESSTNRIRKIAPNGVITTIAGGAFGFSGDGGPAMQAAIRKPTGLALDAAGNLYFSDSGNRRVRRIAANGTITTVAGNGEYGFAGDGGKATNANLITPEGLAIDAAGNLYIADYGTWRVRKVTPAGIISTAAGNGGNITFPEDVDNVPATTAPVGQVMGVDVDAQGNVYIAAFDNDVLLKVSAAGVMTRHVELGYMIPYDVKVGADGTLYVGADCVVLKIATSGAMTRYGGTECGLSPEGTPATSAKLYAVTGIAVDAAGNIYGAEAESSRVLRITAADPRTSTFAGGPIVIPDGTAALSAKFGVLNALAVDDAGAVILSDRPASRIRKLAQGVVTTIAGNGVQYMDVCGDPCTALSMPLPRNAGVATAPGGLVYVSDRLMGSVHRVHPNGAIEFVASSHVSGYEQENVPSTSIRVVPRGIATDAAGNLYIADYGQNRVRKVKPDGLMVTFAGTGESGVEADGVLATTTSVTAPQSIATDLLGNVYIYQATGVVRRVSPNGIIRDVAGLRAGHTTTGDPTNALNASIVATGIAVDRTGLYIATWDGIKRVTPNGRVQTIIGISDEVVGLSIKRGFLYVSTGNGMVVRTPVRTAPLDFDDDHKSDVLWRDATGNNFLWRTVDKLTTQTISSVGAPWILAGQGDFDGDGKADILWRNPVNGANTIWRSGNSAAKLAVANMTDLAWSVAGVGDFDGDGRSDLVWRNKTTGQNTIWRSANHLATLAVATTPDPNWQLAGIGDFDADGKSDLVWRHATTGMNAIWRSANNKTALAVTGVTNVAWKIAGVGDFDGDGYSDLAWRNASTGGNTIWRSAKSHVQIAVTGVSNTQWTIVGTGDYDNDGRSDLFWRNPVTGANVVWKAAKNTAPIAVPNMGSNWKAVPYEGQP